MKIWCQYRPGSYVIDPAILGQPDRLGRRETIPGLRVEFVTLGGPGSGSLLDTEEQARLHGWSEDVRERVEAYLQAHRDWGFSLFLADEALTAVRHAGASCQVMTMVSGGVRKCDRPVQNEGDLCDVHEGQRTSIEVAEAQPELPAPPPLEATV